MVKGKSSRSINLSPRDKPKSKKQNKYSKINKPIKKDYQFNLRESLIYIGGLYEDKTGLKCIVISRSQKRNGKQYYKVEFEDGLIVESIPDVLKKMEEKTKKESDN